MQKLTPDTRLVAIDVETHAFDRQISRVRDRFRRPTLVCVQIASAEGELILYPEDPKGECVLRAQFEREDTVIVGHNFSFDLGVLLQEWPDWNDLALRAVLGGRILDTMVLAHLREPDVDSKRLDELARRHLNVRMTKDETRTSFQRGVPLTEAQKKYATDDVLVTLQLAKHLLRVPYGSIYERHDQPRHEVECEEKHNLPGTLDQVFSAAAVASGVWIEPNGWTINRDLLEKKREETRREATAVLGTLAKEGLAEPVKLGPKQAPVVAIESTRAGRKWTWVPENDRWERTFKGQAQTQATRWKLNMRRIRQVFTAEAEEHGIKAPSTPTGSIQTSYKFWKPYRAVLSPAVQALMEYQRAHKLETAFFASWSTSRTGELYPQYFIPGTATLRDACSKPNLQQVPKALRPILHRPGRVIVGADYSALEIYTLVHHMLVLGIDGPLRAMLLSGQDPHSYAASLLAGGTPADHGKETKTRQSAKAANFGLPGGLGAEKFYFLGRSSYGLEWTLPEATETRRAYLREFWDVAHYVGRLRELRPGQLKPDDVPYHEWLDDLGFDAWPGSFELAQAMDDGRIYDVDLSTGFRIPARTFTQAANAPFQSLGAVIITLAKLLALEEGLNVVGAVHDALYVDCATGEETETAAKLERCMEQAFVKVCPLAPPQVVQAETSEHFF